MRNKEEFEKIVGKENVSDAKEVLAKYARDYSLVPPACLISLYIRRLPKRCRRW